MKFLSIVALVAVALTACATRQHRDMNGRLELDGNQVVHVEGEPYFCFTSVGNGAERHECAVSNDQCQQRLAGRKGENFEITATCRPGEAVYCFAWAEGETTNSLCYETEPDCNELVVETGTRVGKDNVSACQHFDRTHRSF